MEAKQMMEQTCKSRKRVKKQNIKKINAAIVVAAACGQSYTSYPIVSEGWLVDMLKKHYTKLGYDVKFNLFSRMILLDWEVESNE